MGVRLIQVPLYSNQKYIIDKDKLQLLPLQFFPSPVKPYGQEPQDIEYSFSLHCTPG